MRHIRRAASPSRLGSSDAVPSEHNSIFDGETVQDVGSVSSDCGLRDRSGGTRLCTITEQKSIQTLKTIPSVWTFQRRLASLEPPLCQDRTQPPTGQRRRRFSADDILTRVLGNSSADLPETPRKAEPLFEPPFRRKTPPGYPRWPGENNTLDGTGQSHFGWPSLMQWLRSHGPNRSPLDGQQQRRLQEEFARHRRRPNGQRWRPPRSAHATHRFADLSSHPFASAPSSHVPLTEAQRALRRVSENHIPVTPKRADTTAARRLAPLPANIRSNLSIGRRPDAVVPRSTGDQLDGTSVQQGAKLCRHKLSKLKNGHGISSPVLLAHHGQSASSFDGTSPDIPLHELPPIPVRELPPIPSQDRFPSTMPYMDLQSENTQRARSSEAHPDTRVLHFSPTTTFISSPDDTGTTFQVPVNHPFPGIAHATTFSTARTSDTITTDPGGRA